MDSTPPPRIPSRHGESSRAAREVRDTLAERPGSRRQRAGHGEGAASLAEQVEEAPLHEMVNLLTRSLRAEAPTSDRPVVKLVMRSGQPDEAPTDAERPADDGSDREPSQRLSRPVLSDQGTFPSDAPTAPFSSLPSPPRIPKLKGLEAFAPDAVTGPEQEAPGTTRRRWVPAVVLLVVAVGLALAWPAYRHLIVGEHGSQTNQEPK
ncbi:MAG: hypothetical protein OXU20_29805 [Myxococcales bacterium]|nr:hypothetical protein [Myxococcales bacterium]